MNAAVVGGSAGRSAYLVDQVSRAPGQVDVVAVGPLTDIANAITATPSLARDVRHLWIMGAGSTPPSPSTT
ncbi:nucleoside hydrolase [Nonomuraea sp. NPDC000554]|uniref:nucleoside hydrolase n=1 Tax=Nonomuraea sp. NPDC000554 TaxID=3154259 RepID=UPI00331C1B26